MKKILLVVMLFMLGGCAVNVATKFEPSEVCIRDNPKVEYADFKTALEVSFARHGVKIVDERCEALIKYSVRRHWDGAVYPIKAVVAAYDINDNMIALSSWINANALLKFFQPQTVSDYLVDGFYVDDEDIGFFNMAKRYDSIEEIRKKDTYGCGDCRTDIFNGNLDLEY
jgi:hypothetical protein